MSLASGLLALALLGQVGLTIAVYLVMARERFAAGRRGEIKIGDYVLVQNEPPHLARLTRHVANQFELPVLFYVLVLLFLAIGGATLVDAVLGWIFVASRVVHAVIHIRTENVRRRSQVFRFGVAMVGLLSLHAVYVVVAAIA